MENYMDIRMDIIRRWSELWYANTEKDVWFKTLIPNLEDWLLRDRTMEVDFFMTQFLTGHGTYKYYLYRFKLDQSPNCPFCSGNVIDDARHTFFVCDRFTRLRLEFYADLDEFLKVENFQQVALSSPANWFRIKRYARDVLTLKSRILKGLEANLPPT